MLLENLVILVTGCSRGIGKAIASQCAKYGATVYAVARKEGSLESLESMDSGKVIPLYFDVTDLQAAKNAVSSIVKECGRLDALINNAGIMTDAAIGMISHNDLMQMFQTNVFSALELLQLAARVMMRKKSGSIINLASIAGLRGSGGQTAYSASKGAIASMTLSAAHELGKHGIRVNAVAPGFIDTEMFNGIPEQKREQALARVSLGRIGSPDDVANACVFLASPLSAYVSGQILGVDGDIV